MGLITSYTGLEQIANINPYSGASYTFGTAAEAIEFANQSGFTVIDGLKVPTQFQNVTPDLTGGAQQGNIISMPQAGTEGVGLVTAGAGVSLGFGAVVGGVLAGMGIGIIANDLAPEFWANVSNKIFGTNVPPARISEYFLPGLYNNGKTYVSNDIVQKIREAAIENNLFNTKTTSSAEIPIIDVQNRKVKFTTSLGCNVATCNILFRNAIKNSNSHDVETIDFFPKLAHVTNIFNNAYNNFLELNPGITPNGMAVSAARVGNRVDFYVGIQYLELNSFKNIQTVGSWQDNTEHFVDADNASYQYVLRYYLSDLENPQYIYFTSIFERIVFIYNDVYQFELEFPDNNSYENVEVPPTDGVTDIVNDSRVLDPNAPFSDQYWEWYQQAFDIFGVDDDGIVGDIKFLPLPQIEIDPYKDPAAFPTYDPYGNPDPESNPQEQTWTGENPDAEIDPWQDPAQLPYPDTAPYPTVKPWIDISTEGSPDPVPPNPDPTPTPGGSGTTPIPIIPPIGGDANALFTVYNPTKAQLNSLGGVLWSSSIIQQIIQIFTNNPMDAIISLHLIYCTPSTGTSKNIKLGYIDTQVSALEVTNQYKTVDCGYIDVPEFYGDCRDYEYTEVNIYLPFIGVRGLKSKDIVGSRVSVSYNVDIFTGTILCMITISKSGANQILYTFEGNCSVDLPLTGADRSRQLSTLTGVITGAVTGSPLLAVGGLMSGGMQSNIQRSGNFSGNAGAMGIKKPYLIISRNIPSDAANFNAYYGFTANKTVSLGSLSGFVRVKEIHLDGIPATDAELQEIETLLKEGVII